MTQHETVADVIADMMRRAEHAHDAALNDPDETVHHEAVSQMLVDFADRLKVSFENGYRALELHCKYLEDEYLKACQETTDWRDKYRALELHFKYLEDEYLNKSKRIMHLESALREISLMTTGWDITTGEHQFGISDIHTVAKTSLASKP